MEGWTGQLTPSTEPQISCCDIRSSIICGHICFNRMWFYFFQGSDSPSSAFLALKEIPSDVFIFGVPQGCHCCKAWIPGTCFPCSCGKFINTFAFVLPGLWAECIFNFERLILSWMSLSSVEKFRKHPRNLLSKPLRILICYRRSTTYFLMPLGKDGGGGDVSSWHLLFTLCWV